MLFTVFILNVVLRFVSFATISNTFIYNVQKHHMYTSLFN